MRDYRFLKAAEAHLKDASKKRADSEGSKRPLSLGFLCRTLLASWTCDSSRDLTHDATSIEVHSVNTSLECGLPGSVIDDLTVRYDEELLHTSRLTKLYRSSASM